MDKLILVIVILVSCCFADVHPGLKRAIDNGDYKTAENLIKRVGVKDVYCPEHASLKETLRIYDDIFYKKPSIMWEKCDERFIENAENSLCKESIPLCKYYLQKHMDVAYVGSLKKQFDDMLQSKIYIHSGKKVVERAKEIKTSTSDCIDNLEEKGHRFLDSVSRWSNVDECIQDGQEELTCMFYFNALLESVEKYTYQQRNKCFDKPTKLVVIKDTIDAKINPFVYEIVYYGCLLAELMRDPFYFDSSALYVYKELLRNDVSDDRFVSDSFRKKLVNYVRKMASEGKMLIDVNQNDLIQEISKNYASSGMLSDSLVAFSCRLFPKIDRTVTTQMGVDLFDCNVLKAYATERSKCIKTETKYFWESPLLANYVCDEKKMRIADSNEKELNMVCSQDDIGKIKYDMYCAKNVGWIKNRTYEKIIDNRDGQEYRTVSIGNQKWMAENLNYDANGSLCYEQSSDNCHKFGRLYWPNAIENICPDGWRVPNISDWKKLFTYIKDSADVKLKSATGWEKTTKGKNGNGIDSFGFSILPAGYIKQVSYKSTSSNEIKSSNSIGKGTISIFLSLNDDSMAHNSLMLKLTRDIPSTISSSWSVKNDWNNMFQWTDWDEKTFASVRCIKK